MDKRDKKIDINDEFLQRQERLHNIVKRKLEPYPARTSDLTNLSDFLVNFKSLLKNQKTVTLAGRISSIRLQGAIAFLNIEDFGNSVQIFLRKDNLGSDNFTNFKELFDEGDFAEFSGKAFVTKTKQPTLLASDLKILSKSLLPIPDRHFGLKDPDTRYRKRYLDLLSNPEIKNIFVLRSKIIKLLREYFDKNGFEEVDTPILQTIAGGATAKPFTTHHNALDMDMYLRVAPELFLKRLIVGGYEKVYEIARCFRNEGIDHQHNPEFTQLEAYWAYKDYTFLMEYVEKLFEFLARQATGSAKVKCGKQVLNFKAPYPELDFRKSLLKALKIDIDKASDKQLLDLAKKMDLGPEKSWGRGKLLDELYKKSVRKNLVQPTFIINHPIELSPLSKKIAGNPRYVERFQLVINTAEVCNAFSELNDPLDQEERFKEQLSLKKAGDEEAQGADMEFVEALKIGMPPTVGIGIGIERLVMLLGNIENIKEVILFPTMRPKIEENK